MEQPVIEIRDLYKRIWHGQGSLEILAGISLQIDAGEFVAVRGPSGSGKSTLLGLIAGLDRPTSGSICIAGREISSLSEDELARLRRHTIGIVFQSYQLIATLTAYENVVLPHQLAGGTQRDGVKRANSLLEQVGLASRSDHYPLGPRRRDRHEYFRRRDDFPAGRVMLADKRLVEPQFVDPFDELHVALEGQRRIFTDAMEWGHEDAEFHLFLLAIELEVPIGARAVIVVELLVIGAVAEIRPIAFIEARRVLELRFRQVDHIGVAIEIVLEDVPRQRE